MIEAASNLLLCHAWLFLLERLGVFKRAFLSQAVGHHTSSSFRAVCKRPSMRMPRMELCALGDAGH